MSNNEELPENFIEQVKEALEKLYNFQALQENPLTRKFEAGSGRPLPAHQLRGQLIEAIESLNPGENVAAASGTARLYNLIYMHYVGRLTIQQAAWEVGVSLRQAYRDLRRGQELVSAFLWHKLQSQPETPPVPPSESVNEELTRLGDNTTMTTLQDMLDSAVRPIQILAEKFNVTIQIEAPASPILMTTNLIVAQQILTHLLSQVIQQVRPTALSMHLFEDSTFMRMRYPADGQPNLEIKPVIQQMMAQVGWELNYRGTGGAQEICLTSSGRSALILLIDDNEGLTHLIQHYLTEDGYTVMSIPNTEAGLAMVPQLQPDAIILDVMMPGIDGWELLQRLRTREATRFIPVIICSVINDPELAFALGASQYVPKPVNRETLRLALQQLRV
jgi:CheY-like chemotaxis protein